jgi:glyoxylase-like metal-dependent hydrolase (beta-lactamase superfamily II)
LFVCLVTITSCFHGSTSPSTSSSAEPGRLEYEVYAIQYAGLKDVPVKALIPGADPDRKLDTAFMIWLIRGHGHTILVDAGFYRARFLNDWHPVDYIEPSLAIARLGLKPEDITDVIITHLHWDHADGVDLFPNAHVWIQKDELRHYASEAYDKPSNAGVFAEDVLGLVELDKQGKVTLIDGDGRAIFPGITAYTGGKHTFQSQFIGVNTSAGMVILASDNVYLYENIDRHLPITATLDAKSNLRAQDRMKQMVTDAKFIIPGHDALVMTRFPHPVPGVAKIQ